MMLMTVVMLRRTEDKQNQFFRSTCVIIILMRVVGVTPGYFPLSKIMAVLFEFQVEFVEKFAECQF